MKKIINFTVLLVAFAIVFASCSESKPKTTIKNLKEAITGETNASATYKAFSAKAAQEGYVNISKMFAAASAAEAIHVNNHNEVLAQLGEAKFTPTAGAPKVSGTADNIQAAVDGETFEYTVMYPGFIASAKTEKGGDVAINSFTWASDAEAVHAKLYAQSLGFLKVASNDESVAAIWFTCPKCGNLFNTIEGIDRCSLCGVRSSTFLKF